MALCLEAYHKWPSLAFLLSKNKKKPCRTKVSVVRNTQILFLFPAHKVQGTGLLYYLTVSSPQPLQAAMPTYCFGTR